MAKNFAIIGGGVAGLTAAIGLLNLGHHVTIFERVAKLKGIGAGFGLGANAMHALAMLGLRDGVEKIGHFLPSYNILDQKGHILLAPDTNKLTTNFNQKNFAIHRADLHRFLIDQLPAEVIRTGKEATGLRQDENKVYIEFVDGDSMEVDALIVADGVKSKLRQLLVPTATPRYAGYTCWRAVIDNSEVALKLATETWGTKGRFGMTPLVNNKLYWYACVNAPQNSLLYKSYGIADLATHFSSYHEPITRILKATKDEQLLWNDIIDIKPLNTLAYNRVLLIGDAGHATTPNLGQGACQAIEDVAVLIEKLSQEENIVKAFRQISQLRLPRTRYITKTSWQVGKIAQWHSPLAITIRNFCMRLLPEPLKQLPLKKLINEDFMSSK
ncbi:FAD-dependent monooxygenase [Sphingobacterium sp. LRF_L2]|uniref:FAD-dependent monooxygenase n=1 Tax=Sphingobacterium sp. LRF_L2 TaxID=3369421 RepID=UPI003F616476